MASSLATSNKPELFPIQRTLLYIEWTVILVIAVVFAAFNNFNGRVEQSYVHEIIIVYLCLSACASLSLFFPIGRPLWQRRAYVALEIIALLPTRVLTGWNLELLLYLFLVKSCFLLNRRDVVITFIAAGVAWQLFAIPGTPGTQLFLERRDREHLHPEKTFASRMINDTGSYIGAGTFVVLFSFSLLAEQESRKRAAALTKQMEVLSATLERTRIARDIHDSLGHTLTTLDVQLALSQRAYQDNPNQSLQALNTAKDLASQSLTEVRCALRNMHEKNFDLHRALHTLTEQVQQGQSFEIHVDTNLPQLPPQIGYQIYRIVQEGLTNIQKHAQATSVHLGGEAEAGQLTLELADNGQGFNAQVAHTGFGLRGMQERAMLLKGQLDIKSAPGRGTRIYITIPL
jgi:signal transduction histidine kinase